MFKVQCQELWATTKLSPSMLDLMDQHKKSRRAEWFASTYKTSALELIDGQAPCTPRPTSRWLPACFLFWSNATVGLVWVLVCLSFHLTAVLSLIAQKKSSKNSYCSEPCACLTVLERFIAQNVEIYDRDWYLDNWCSLGVLIYLNWLENNSSAYFRCVSKLMIWLILKVPAFLLSLQRVYMRCSDINICSTELWS